MDNSKIKEEHNLDKEYIKSLEISVKMLQREIMQLRNSQPANIALNNTPDDNLTNQLRKLISFKHFDDLKSTLSEIFYNLLSFIEIEIFTYDSKNKLINPLSNDVKTALEMKAVYLEEEGIIDWAFNSDSISFIKDLTISMNEKELYFIILPLKLSNVKKGIVILNTENSKESLSNELIYKINQIIPYIAVAVDNIQSHSEIQQMNNRLNSLNRKMAESSYYASLGGIIKSMINEMQQPILILESNIKLIENGIDNSPKRFQIINEQINIINNIYEKVRHWTHINKESTELIEKDLVELANESIMMINSQLTREGIRIVFENQSDYSKIFCSPPQLSQVFVNILLFMSSRIIDGGEIYITINNNSRNQTSISFIDNGIGIEEEILPDYQFPEKAETINSEIMEMQYIKNVVEINGGRLLINSVLGKGTTIKIIFTLISK